MKVSPVSHSMAQEGGSRTRTPGLAAQGCIGDSKGSSSVLCISSHSVVLPTVHIEIFH